MCRTCRHCLSIYKTQICKWKIAKLIFFGSKQFFTGPQKVTKLIECPKIIFIFFRFLQFSPPPPPPFHPANLSCCWESFLYSSVSSHACSLCYPDSGPTSAAPFAGPTSAAPPAVILVLAYLLTTVQVPKGESLWPIYTTLRIVLYYTAEGLPQVVWAQYGTESSLHQAQIMVFKFALVVVLKTHWNTMF